MHLCISDHSTDVVYVTSLCFTSEREERLDVEDAGSGSVLVGALTAAVEGVVDDHDETSSRILDAAYELFCRIGIQRSTMEDVARGAGVSRITVYRRFATKGALVDQLVRREIRRYLDQFRIDIEHAETAADRVVLGFGSAAISPRITGLRRKARNELTKPSTTRSAAVSACSMSMRN